MVRVRVVAPGYIDGSNQLPHELAIRETKHKTHPQTRIQNVAIKYNLLKCWIYNIENYSVSMVGNASEWLTLGAVTKTEDIFGVILSGTPDDDNLYQNDISLNIIDNSEGEAVEKNVYFSIIIDAVNDAPVVVSYSGISEIYEE